MKYWLAMLALLLACPAQAQQSQPFHLISAANTNSTVVKPGAGVVVSVVAINTTTSIYFLKFYDIATAPLCNTTPVKFTFPVPFGATNAGGGLAVALDQGPSFVNGIGICLTGGINDNDNTVAAAGVAISVFFK
jgi:hypothetical protein